MSALSLRIFWKSIAIAAALSFLYASVLVKLGHDWWTDENYSHGLLIPFIIGYIIWIGRERLDHAPKQPEIFRGSALVIVALFALWVGTAGAELFIQRISLVIMLAGIVIYFWGFRLLRLLLVPALLLLLAIPIPSIIFNKIAFPLQLFASRCAVWLMRVFDIPVLRQGNVIELMPRGASVSKKMEVVEACSGIRSLMTLVTLAVVFAYFTYSPRNDGDGQGGSRIIRSLKSYGFWRSVIVVLAAIPIAIAANAVRVGGTGVLAHYFGSKIADGFFHYLSGWVVYVLALILLFALAWLLDRTSGVFEKLRQRSEPKLKKEETALAEKASNAAGIRTAPASRESIPIEETD